MSSQRKKQNFINARIKTEQILYCSLWSFIFCW